MVYLWVGIWAIIACLISYNDAQGWVYLVCLSLYISGLFPIAIYRVRRRNRDALK